MKLTNFLSFGTKPAESTDSSANTCANPNAIVHHLPEEYRQVFEKIATKQALSHGLLGCYLSSHVDNNKLLALDDQQTFHLLFFSSDANPQYQFLPRYYTGACRVTHYDDGETLITLDIWMNDFSLGSDANDEVLTVVTTPTSCLLLSYASVEDIAAGIQWNSQLSDLTTVYLPVQLTDSIPEYAENGMPAPLLSLLPPSLQTRIPSQPLQVSIIEVDNGKSGGDVMVTVNLGTDHGLVMNMPFCTPAGASKYLKGWVWGLDKAHCQLGLDDESDKPEIGDILVSRHPNAGPLV